MWTKKIFTLVLSISLFTACKQIPPADLIVYGGPIYTVDQEFNVVEAMAILDGKIIATGEKAELLNNFKAVETMDLKGKAVFPGLIDAHCHFFRLGVFENKLKLAGTQSYDEIIEKIKEFKEETGTNYITGRGWDQNDWPEKKFPTMEKLNILFPDIPIALTRIDGHALLVNQAALDRAGINNQSSVEGGEFIKDDQGNLTGVLIDAAMDAVYASIPEPSEEENIKSLELAEQISLSYGLTTVDDAGLAPSTIDLIDQLQKEQRLKIKVYAMVSATDEWVTEYIAKGIYKTDRLNVRSFKYYGDGALGSRGAAMREPYSDRHEHYGALIHSPERFNRIAKQIAASDFQMNTHAIGDSTNHFVLETYREVLKGSENRRWRIEHAQIISPEDFEYFEDIIPSIQPTHATSDMYWAEDRIGPERIKTAYAFKDLLKVHGKVALGTDYPVEQVSPFLTFYAAVARQDNEQYPASGFQIENALTREETLRGMTIWAAYSNFEEHEKGSLEVGKAGDFVILSKDLMKADIYEIPDTEVLFTYINGEQVYKK